MIAGAGRSTKDRAAFCLTCGHLEFPAVAAAAECGECGRGRLVPIDPEGTVYTYTVVHVGAPDIGTPYVIGYVDFEGGVRAFGRLAMDDAQIGTRVLPVPGADGLYFERGRGVGGS